MELDPHTALISEVNKCGVLTYTQGFRDSSLLFKLPNSNSESFQSSIRKLRFRVFFPFQSAWNPMDFQKNRIQLAAFIAGIVVLSITGAHASVLSFFRSEKSKIRLKFEFILSLSLIGKSKFLVECVKIRTFYFIGS